MVTFHRSAVDPNWIELKEDGVVLQEVLVRFRFRQMDQVCATVEEALAFLNQVEKKQGRSYAHWLLSAKSYPSALLAKKLSEKGYSDLVVEEIVQALQEKGLIQDGDWISREVERELQAGHGPRFIEAKWRMKGLPAEQVRVHLTDEKQETRLRELWPKLCARKKDAKKAMQALIRRGFDPTFVFSVSLNYPRN
jgi:SOS response regulatory protein OraA/RecX